MSGAILAIDQGTTNTKVLLIAETGAVIASGSCPVTVTYPRPGWAEASSQGLWESVEAAIVECLKQAPETAIVGIGISNQRESILLWDRVTGEPVGPCVIWQCRRSAERLQALRTPEAEDKVRALTGLDLDPLFPAAKIGWLLDKIPDARKRTEAGELCVGTVDSWLAWKLTGGAVHVTDASNAARTQLFDITRQAWSDELCNLFDVPKGLLPEVRDSDSLFGHTVAAGALPAGVPLHAMIGDSHAALFGHGVRGPGATKATYGTGSSLMTLTDTPTASANGLSTTVGWRRGGIVQYALEGNITVSGHAAAWAADMMGLTDANALTDLAQTVDDSNGVYFVPALAGLGAPHWNADARGIFTGLSLSTRPAHLARATLEAIAFQVRDVLVAMETDLGVPTERLMADGGATANALLMQIQADVLGRPVQPAAIKELSAVGAGVMAGTAVGVWNDATAIALFSGENTAFTPQLGDEARNDLVAGWTAAVGRAQ